MDLVFRKTWIQTLNCHLTACVIQIQLPPQTVPSSPLAQSNTIYLTVHPRGLTEVTQTPINGSLGGKPKWESHAKECGDDNWRLTKILLVLYFRTKISRRKVRSNVSSFCYYKNISRPQLQFSSTTSQEQQGYCTIKMLCSFIFYRNVLLMLVDYAMLQIPLNSC